MSSEMQVPDGWSVEQLNDHIFLLTGFAFPSKDMYDDPTGVKLLRGINISKGFTRWGDKAKYWNDTVDSRYELIIGDVVVSMDGSLVGRNYAQIQKNDLPAFLVQRVARLRTKETLDQQYLYCLFGSDFFKSYVDIVKTVTAIPHISPNDFYQYKFFSPPLPEQKKIASILTSVDDVIEKTESQISKLQDLKKGMMTELLTKGIGHTEFKDSPVGRIPKSWGTERYNDITDVITKGTTPTTMGFSYKSYGVNFIKVESIIKDGVIDANKFSFIDNATNNALSRSIISANDILITIAGATVGKLAIAEKKHLPANTNQALAIVRVNKNFFDYSYAFYWLQSEFIKDEIVKIQTVGAQPNLSLAQIGNFFVPCPSLGEQQEISLRLNQTDRYIDKKTRKLTHTKALKKALMNDLLTGKVRVSTTN